MAPGRGVGLGWGWAVGTAADSETGGAVGAVVPVTLDRTVAALGATLEGTGSVEGAGADGTGIAGWVAGVAAGGLVSASRNRRNINSVLSGSGLAAGVSWA